MIPSSDTLDERLLLKGLSHSFQNKIKVGSGRSLGVDQNYELGIDLDDLSLRKREGADSEPIESSIANRAHYGRY